MIPHCIHKAPETKTDDQLEKEAEEHLIAHPAIQCIAELLAYLREANRPWWNAKRVCERFPVSARLTALADRPDIRRDVLLALFDKLPSQTMREISLAFQIDLLERSLANNEITAYGLEHAFNTYHLGLYMNVEEWWHAFRKALPATSEDAGDHDVIRYLCERLLADRSGHAPILRPLDVLMAIDAAAWHDHLPLKLRAAVHNAQLRAEKHGHAFTSADILRTITPEDIARNIPLAYLHGILDAAERSLGIARRTIEHEVRDTDANGDTDPDVVANEIPHDPVFESTPPKA